MSLTDPTSKMSKSHPSERSRILVTDTADDIKAKIASALTDSLPGVSYDTKTRPGLSNLLDILSVFDPHARDPLQLASAYSDLGPRQLKEIVADAVITGLRGIREHYKELLEARPSYLDDVEKEGSRKARENAGRTMYDVKRAVGLQ